MATREGAVEVDGARVSYRIDGEGPDVVLVHAGVADLRMWDPLVAELAARVRTVRFDMRGYGRTTSQPGPFWPVADLDALLTQLAIEEATVVGASFGGLVALELAAAHPGRVGRLVLLDALLPDDHDWSEATDAFFEAE
ncbi:MAG: alpha/beta fold hydrolase, partial [Thermoleophilaceae bacterium]